MEQNADLDNTNDEKPETEYLTDSEMALSALIVEKYAPGLPSDQCSVLLAQVRKFAGIVGGRHYVYGWSDGKKEAEGKAETVAEAITDNNPHTVTAKGPG